MTHVLPWRGPAGTLSRRVDRASGGTVRRGPGQVSNLLSYRPCVSDFAWPGGSPVCSWRHWDRPRSSPTRTCAGRIAAEQDEDVLGAGTFSGLKLRSIGPALMSGRIGDFAVDPEDPSRYFVAVASGGVWRTLNGGTTYEPVFDGEGSYSIGCVTLDPGNPNVVWVGTGENNSQRSVGFGDGVYRSLRRRHELEERMGLETSEHIGMIAVDPRDSDTVYVAAQGPLWRAGGDRGLYKTTDGGATWDPRPARQRRHRRQRGPPRPAGPGRPLRVVLPAAAPGLDADQRRPRVDDLEVDGRRQRRGARSSKGLPKVDLGRIGLGVSPVDPDVVYAIVEAAQGKSGFYRSTDRGETWQKAGDYVPTGAQYYNEIVCDPVDVDRVYALDTFLRRTDDGGQDVPAGAARESARGRPRPVDRSPEQPPPARRVRRRASTRPSTSGRTGTTSRTCPSRSSTASAWTSRGRSTTSTAARRTTTSQGGPSRTTEPGRHHQRGLVPDRRRRRVRDPGRPRRPEHRLQPVAVRRSGPLRPAERRARRHPAAARRRRGAAALELGHAR